MVISEFVVANSRTSAQNTASSIVALRLGRSHIRMLLPIGENSLKQAAQLHTLMLCKSTLTKASQWYRMEVVLQA